MRDFVGKDSTGELSAIILPLVGWCLAKHHVNVVWTSPPPSPPCCWPMSALSTHLINAHTGLINPSASPPFASTPQSARTLPSLVISGPMSYNSAMHGSFNAYPPSPSNISHLSVPDTMRMRFNNQSPAPVLTCRLRPLSKSPRFKRNSIRNLVQSTLSSARVPAGRAS